MPRPISVVARRAIFAPETDQVFLQFLTLAHPNLVPSLYFVYNQVDVVRRGHTHLAWAFQIAMPGEYEDQIATVQIQLDNVNRQIIEGIRALTTPPTITLEVALASDPDGLEAGPFPFTLKHVEYNALTIVGQLQFEDIWNEPYPSFVFDPARFPGLFP